MFKILANYRHNWILLLAFSLAGVLGTILLFSNINPPAGRVNQFEGLPILLLIVFSSVIVPVLEEMSFRGFFSNSKNLRIIAFIGFLAYSSLLFYLEYPIGIASFIVVFILVQAFLYHKYKSNATFIPFVISNAIVFGLIHYSAKDFTVQANPFVLSQIAFGLFFTWITINSKLWIAMVFHGAVNLVAMSILFFSLHFVSDEINVIEQDNVKISYQKVPVLDSDITTVENESDKVIGKNATVKQLLDLALYNSDLKELYSSAVPMARYNFTIEFKDGKRDFETVLKLLSKEELVMKN